MLSLSCFSWNQIIFKKLEAVPGQNKHLAFFFFFFGKGKGRTEPRARGQRREAEPQEEQLFEMNEGTGLNLRDKVS